VDAAYDAELWTDFAIAVVGAAAALAGLLVVAISINIREIVAAPRLPGRAGSALIALMAPLMTGLFLLIPEQSDDALALELIMLGLVLGLVLGLLNWPLHLPPERTYRTWFFGSALPVILLVAPTILAGAGMMVESLGGLYWLPVAVIAAIFGGIGQAWVLLIEILR
jgi:hypothetical protein